MKAGTKKVSIYTLGCKANQYDSSAIEDALRAYRYIAVPFPGPADAFIINTCTVTSKTDSESRQAVRRARKENPEAIVIVTGCYAQVSSVDLSKMDGVDYIVGNPDKADIPSLLSAGRQPKAKVVVGDYRQGAPFSLRAKGAGSRTRANLKIQEGCNRACSYCIIPKARGASKSLPLAEVELEISRLAGAGYKEIVLTGIHLGAYGVDLNGADILSVLELIEGMDLPPDCRFRISSLDPDEVTDVLVDFLKASKRVCDHLHLPLQSGSNSILRKMNRPYTACEFSCRVERLCNAIPDISIGVDVIAGFPGEGEAEFKETCSLLSGLPISYIHIFPYSKRRGTPAADFGQQYDPRVIRERCEVLKAIDLEKRAAFYARFAGREARLLIEGARNKKTGLLGGHTRNYIPVSLEGEDALFKTMADVRLLGYNASGMKGILIDPSSEGAF